MDQAKALVDHVEELVVVCAAGVDPEEAHGRQDPRIFVSFEPKTGGMDKRLENNMVLSFKTASHSGYL